MIRLIKESGGTDGLRDEGLLDSARNAPFQGVRDTEPFLSLQQKAARLGYELIKNHAFTDDNKRSATRHAGFSCSQWHRVEIYAGRLVQYGFISSFRSVIFREYG